MLKKLCLFKIIILTLRHNSKVKPRLSGTQNHQRFYLQHSFFVPENVYLIGCMNTADRSPSWITPCGAGSASALSSRNSTKPSSIFMS